MEGVAIVHVSGLTGEGQMAKVLGVGGLFFKSRDGDAMRDWYGRVLGITFTDWGGALFLPQDAAAHAGSATVFSPFKADTDYFAPSDKEFMFNLMVDDLNAILARAKEQGVEPILTMMDEANGSFAHIMDNEGRKIELWQPKPMS
jgi:predicted enzyme related to lactoylglutathione lyase